MLDQHNPQPKRPNNNTVYYVVLAAAIVITIFIRWPIIPKTLGALALNFICIGGFWWIVLSALQWWNFRQGMKNMSNFGRRKTKR